VIIVFELGVTGAIPAFNYRTTDELGLAIKEIKPIELEAFRSTYKTVWRAGPSIDHVNKIVSVKQYVATENRMYASLIS